MQTNAKLAITEIILRVLGNVPDREDAEACAQEIIDYIEGPKTTFAENDDAAKQIRALAEASVDTLLDMLTNEQVRGLAADWNAGRPDADDEPDLPTEREAARRERAQEDRDALDH